MAEAIRSVLDAYFAGINEERYADVGALFAPAGVLIAPGVPPRRGAAQIAPYFGAALQPYPVHRDQPTRVLVAGRTAIVEITFTGALASGAPMRFEAVDVFDFDAANRIARLTTWYDSQLVRGRLAQAQALAPPAEADVERARSFAQATPARFRAALREVRRGRAVGAGDRARWHNAPDGAGPLAARAVLEAEPRAGDVLLVRSGAASSPLPPLPDVPLAAVALDGELQGPAPDGLVVGERWDLAALEPGAALLFSVPAADGRACAALWR